MSNIVDYIVVSRPTANELYQLVKKQLKYGYQPFGSLQFQLNADFQDGGKLFVQAMVKYEEKNPTKKQRKSHDEPYRKEIT